MQRPRLALGDSHNFGRHVTRRGSKLIKPRSVFWEWLLLAADSPLRKALGAAAAESELGKDAFAFLPTLAFEHELAREGGEVQSIRLKPLSRLGAKQRAVLAGIVGRALALFSWLGLADLHWENLALGLGPRGQIVFGPLDVELVLADLSLPTETKLLPDADPEYADVCRHAAGVRRVLPYLGKPIAVADLLAMASDYLTTLRLLEQHSAGIAASLATLPALRQAPIRVCLRGTGEYVRARQEPIWPPLLEAELQQMARGDIPYFFRLYGRSGIHYYRNRALTQLGTLPTKGDVPQLDPILSLSRKLRSPSRQRLREEGLLTLLGAFDQPDFSGNHQHAGLKVSFRARSLKVVLPDGSELRSPRDLSAVVGSVYLPCRCGEVRSPLVPQVSVCQLASADV